MTMFCNYDQDCMEMSMRIKLIRIKLNSSKGVNRCFFLLNILIYFIHIYLFLINSNAIADIRDLLHFIVNYNIPIVSSIFSNYCQS